MYKFFLNINLFNFKYIEYKNGYFLGLVGANITIRIFIIKTLLLNWRKNLILFNKKTSYQYIKFYFSYFLCPNFKFKFKKFIKYIVGILNTKLINLCCIFKSILWFKGKAFRINKLNKLFINTGRLKHSRFEIPNSFNFDLSRKKKFLRLGAYSDEFLQLYIHLLQDENKPNPFTGNGIRIKNKVVQKKLGKRRVY